MDRLFLFQLATSFIVGGIAVAALSLIAEKANPKVAGVLMSLPSTQAISLLFMGWVASPQAVADSFPVVPIALGGSVIFVMAYVYLACMKLSKPVSIFVSATLGLCIWMAIAVPIALFDWSNVAISIGLYCILMLIAHYFLSVRPQINFAPVTMHYTIQQKAIRALVAGSLIALVVFCAKNFSAAWGGVFSIFPAAYFSTLLILHREHDGPFLFRIARTIPIASPIFVIYAWAAMYTFPAFGPLLGTIGAYAASLIYFFCFVQFIKSKTEESG